MNDTPTATISTGASPAQHDADLIDLLLVLAKHKKKIILWPLGVGLVAAALSLTLDNVYKATTKLLPPQQAQSGAAALLSQLGGAAGAVAGMTGLKNPNELYIGMLKSRTIADKVIARFDLQKLYNEKTMDRTRLDLEENTIIADGKDGLITISVLDKDPKRVAAMANAYVEELLKLTRVLAVTEAGKRRLFFERQLEMSKDQLAAVEMQLKGSLDTNGVINVETDSRAILETVARLRAQIAAKEIQLSAMRSFVTDDNQEYKRADAELSGLKTELSKLQNGRPATAAEAGRAGDEAGLGNIKLLRDVKYKQMLYELLAKQYEIARLDEAKDAAIIQVLDPAIEPEKKFKPMRSILVLVPTMLTFFLALMAAFFIEGKKKYLLDAGRASRWTSLHAQLKLK